jgi:hypothetical protein
VEKKALGQSMHAKDPTVHRTLLNPLLKVKNTYKLWVYYSFHYFAHKEKIGYRRLHAVVETRTLNLSHPVHRDTFRKENALIHTDNSADPVDAKHLILFHVKVSGKLQMMHRQDSPRDHAFPISGAVPIGSKRFQTFCFGFLENGQWYRCVKDFVRLAISRI